MKLLQALFSDSGSISMMRVMSLLCCLNAIVVGVIGLNKPTPDYSGVSLLCSVFLSAAFGGKIMQKSIEAKGVKLETKSE